MPDPLPYLWSFGLSAVAAGLVVLALAGPRRPAGLARLNMACLLAMGLGLGAGAGILGWRWPPASGLDRFLTIVIPAALLAELILGLPRVPRRLGRCLRAALAMATPWVLLHGSVYLSAPAEGSPARLDALILAASGLLLAIVWGLTDRLWQRSGGVALPLALGLTALCTGLMVMMAGYIRGGAMAFPIAAAIMAAAIVSMITSPRLQAPSLAGLGVVGLFGLLFIGRFFGRLPPGSAIILLLAPLLCWATELPFLRCAKRWQREALRLVLVAIPLAVLLIAAKRGFDRDMAPLLP
ncbi:MAG: hypothetical protein AB7O62_23865 [Pirellulales bacterium]